MVHELQITVEYYEPYVKNVLEFRLVLLKDSEFDWIELSSNENKGIHCFLPPVFFCTLDLHSGQKLVQSDSVCQNERMTETRNKRTH